MEMKRNKLKLMCVSAMLTAAVFVLTAYLHIPSHTGYVHIGDGLIYIAACILPLPYASFVGVCGALLADCLTGYAVWAPASAVIKFVIVLIFSRKKKKIICVRNLASLLPAGIVNVLGYYLYEAAISRNLVAPLAAVAGNVMQSIVSSVIFVVLGSLCEKIVGERTF